MSPTEKNPTERIKGEGAASTGTLMELAGLAPQSIIRTETVLSRLPIHNLAKKGSINISIMRKGTDGQVQLSWEVSPSRKHGEPRQLAYKIDTLIVNRRIEEKGRPLPPVIALGSVRQICRDLGINEGKGSNDVKRAILQNSSAYITAKLTYKSNDGAIRRLDANFTRYSVVFTGEQLPDGRTADGVYLILNEPYREVLNSAPVRPLNYDYLRKLPPTQQRFYELVSYRIFAALKFQREEAKMAYSEYCTYSAQQRYHDYNRFKKQMYKVHRPHLASGYLKSIRYRETTDQEGNPDWFMYYVPGPKARAEYNAFTSTGKLPEAAVEALGGIEAADERPVATPAKRRAGPRQGRLPLGQPHPEGPGRDQAPMPSLTEVTSRGISEARARELLVGANPDFILDQLEWGDFQIAQAGRKIRNPAGFYIHIIEQKIPPPPDFETSRRRKAREEARAAESVAQTHRFELEEAYRAYRNAEVERHIAAHMGAEERERRIAARIRQGEKEQWRRGLPGETLREIAERELRLAVSNDIPLLTLEEFGRTYRAGDPPTASIETA